MNGYILTTTQNTHGWVVYENDISTDYQIFSRENEGILVPSAKLIGDRRYSIISDYLGTPVEAYDEEGQRVWARELDIYGRIGAQG